ncbi:MAG: efflux RND transporter periplasmic adaptor subunit [Azonexus sp.]|jgi:HlyD family secretion protein|uniref:efflux RND transporter periplasmic adaptor subunit n=1 Tax=Azonexus sp. TaxID=1872668 RepID=UPI00282B5CEA|nr:efflux RND transporter periplasmic adaptor subunit [Azonexus sp.]MDR0776414.1 efflux RND transporter periplasmic adaptor subunit [Azonexus sp.]
MNKRIAIGALVALLLAALAGWLWSARTASTGQGTLTLFGNVDIRQVSLAFQDSERIDTMLVDEGAKVKAGQVLATLDSRTLELQAAQARTQIAVNEQALLRLRNGSRPQEVAQAQARVDTAQADVQLAEQEFKRVRAAADETQDRAVSGQERDRVAAQLKAAQARLNDQTQALRLAQIGPRKEDVDQAAAQLQLTRDALAVLEHRITLHELKAPSDAVVRSRLAEPGDMASPQRPVYALALVQPKWIRAYVNAVQLAQVQPGMPAQISIDGLPGETLPGQIGFISSVAEFTPKSVQTPELRTSLVYEIRVLVDDPQDRLRLGMPATVSLQTKAAQGR